MECKIKGVREEILLVGTIFMHISLQHCILYCYWSGKLYPEPAVSYGIRFLFL